MPKNTFASPSRSASIAATVSSPGSRGGSNPNSSRSRSRKCAGGRSQMPIVRSPWTLEWPRTGQRPAPGLPMLPWRNATFAISLTVATALRCWVMPIAQQVTVAEESRNIRAAASTCSRDSPVARRTTSQSSALTCAAQSSNPTVCRSTKSRSTQPHSSSSEPIAWKSARSPLIRTGRCRSASSVPRPARPRAFCGFLKRTRPASRSGLIARILAPLRFAVSRAVSIRGWLVPGFWPAITISSASWMSCSDTEPLPMPMTSASATDVDSWHMLEQSGKLLVPNARTKSW